MLLKRRLKRISVLFLTVLLTAQSFLCPVRSAAQSGTVNTDRLNLRTGPGTSYGSAAVLTTNTRVTVLSSAKGSDGFLWYQVSAGGKEGWLRSDYVNLETIYDASDEAFETYMNEQGFPESYKNALRGLHEKHPAWIFQAMQIEPDWETAAAEESRIGRNLVESDADSSWKSTAEGAFDWSGNYWPGFDGSTWVAASSGLIRHYMDPRNFLSEPYIYQFQVQTYDPSVQTREGLLRMVKGTFLEGSITQNTGAASDTSGGPGTVSSSSQNGPGSSSTENGPVPGSSGSGAASSQGPSGSSSGTSSADSAAGGPVLEYRSDAGTLLFSLFGGITSLAGWQTENGNWVWLNEDGARLSAGWYWLDGNRDGISECYYFDENGIMARSTQIGSYTVNDDGQWTVNGSVQTKGNEAASTGTDTLYADLLMEAAEQSGVSPYVLAAMILQEQGTDGASAMISGTYSGYYGYYNFYNIAAYEHDGMSAVEAGLKYASESGNGSRPWNTVEKAVIGGAVAYGANYTDSGQDTFYLKKFNVQGSNLYNHQFMTNVVAAAQEGAKLSSAYTDEIRDSALVFRIPVYSGMPEEPCDLPVGTGNPNNRLNLLSVDGFTLTPTFQMNTTEYSLIVDYSVQSISIQAQTVDQKASVTGGGIRQLGTGLNEILLTVTAENGDTRTYRISVTRKEADPSSGPGVNTGPSGGTEPSSGSSAPSGQPSADSGPSTGSQVTSEENADPEPSVVILGPPM